MKPPYLDEQGELDIPVAPRTARKPKKPRSKLWFWKLLALFLMSTGAFTALFYLYLRYAPLPHNEIVNTSKIVAADGSTLTDLVKSGENRVKVPLRDIPQTLIDATISVEDQQFYKHSGINPVGIARALVKDLKTGQWVAGGSTITQQLTKNLFLTQDQTFTRKLHEAVLTLQMEMNYSKDEILEQYLNVIYYGQGAYGIEKAAETYFNKKAKDLTLPESSMLAGLPQAPSDYNPFLNFDKAKERQRIVLDLMVKEGKITREQANSAFTEELHLANSKSPVGSAPYFTDFVNAQLKNTYGYTEEQLYRGGMTIKTTLDPNMQKAAEQAVAEELAKLPTSKGMQVSLLAMDPQTGEIKAMVGGRNYNESTYNRVLAKRQPGSAFKPFVYLTALNNKYTPATRIMSKHTTFEYEDQGQQKSYEVNNFGNNYYNDFIPFRQAIARSDNVFAVTTVMDIGLDKVITTAKTLGIQSDLMPFPSLALGTFPATPLEMVKAYAALANGGYRVEPHAIAEVTNEYEKEVLAFDNKKTAIIDEGSAFILSDMMRAVLNDPNGTAYRVHDIFPRPAAAKTGTTDTDAWMIGYTPQLVTAVWVGYDKDRLLSVTESHAAAPIWAKFMAAAHANLPAKDFPVPSNVVEVAIDPNTGQIATENCPVKQREYFLIGSEPTDWCTEHPSMTSTMHSIEKKTDSGVRSFWNWITGKNKSE